MIISEVRDGSADPRGGPGRVEALLGWSGTGRGTLEKVWDGLGNLGKSRTVRSTIREVQDGSRDPRKGPGQVGGPFTRSGTGRGTLEKVRDGLGK